MGRFGITYDEVAEAAQDLQTQGANPTVELVRRKMGTGSNTTIALHLRTWRERQDEAKSIASKGNLSDKLMAAV